MSLINENPDKVKLIYNFFYREYDFLKEALSRLTLAHGHIEARLEPIPFQHTTYYEQEMGGSLMKSMASFASLVDRNTLIAVKHEAERIERELAESHGTPDERPVNIDPGLLMPEKFVLSTAKNFPQRIYLDRGVYAELTLIYRHGRFEALPWTYTDYLESPVLRFLEKARHRLLDQLRSSQKPPRISEK